MGNPFFQPGAQRSSKVRELFDGIAPRYDLINDVQSLGLHHLWKLRVVRMADPRPGRQALDLCCGTGDLARRLAARGAWTVGADFSGPMLQQAARRKPLRGAALSWVQADALELPFADGSFDLVTIAYGLRNLSDFSLGLAAMQRVLKPGGRLLILDFGKPANRLWRALYFAYLQLAVPLYGRIFAGNADAYAYILESLKNYPAQTGVDALLQELGFTSLRVVNLLGGVMSINYGEKC